VVIENISHVESITATFAVCAKVVKFNYVQSVSIVASKLHKHQVFHLLSLFIVHVDKVPVQNALPH